MINNFKKFNEMRIVDNIKTTISKTDDSLRIIRFIYVDDKVKDLFKKTLELGKTAYYYNDNYELSKVPVSSNNIPYKLVKTDINGNLKQNPTKELFKLTDKNPYGDVYFLTDSEYDKISKLAETIGSTLKLMDEKKATLLDLISSTVAHIDEVKPQ
jgi:hypothetical protein